MVYAILHAWVLTANMMNDVISLQHAIIAISKSSG